MADADLSELRQLLDEWEAELAGRNQRLPIFKAKGDEFAYQLEYARITMLIRHIGALADVLRLPRSP